jgi:acetyltransferase-like isoleucine patch superfamily enzyme/dTDP-4-dehydrorhamnose 3,5-epimerase-like enzyme
MNIHNSAICDSGPASGAFEVGAFSRIEAGAQIGNNCVIEDHVTIETGAVLGHGCVIARGAYVSGQSVLEDNVYIGPHAVLTNRRFPRATVQPGETVEPIRIEQSCSVGAGAVILPGLRLGRSSMVGAGAVVTLNVPPYAVVVGNPGRIVGYDRHAGVHMTSRKPDPQVPPQHAAGDTIEGVRLFRLRSYRDARGSLIPVELDRDLPFRPARVFLVYGAADTRIRGEHAHRECHQVLVCLHGSVNVFTDNGIARHEFTLQSPDEALWLKPGIWASQHHFSPDARLLVYASHPYSDADYVRDYETFLKLYANE